MFAIYCEGGQWLVTENGQDDNERFVYAACKWHALQIQNKELAQAVLKRIRAHGMGAWIVPIEALALDCSADKMTRQESRAIAALTNTLIEQNAAAYIGQPEAFQYAAWQTLRWLLGQDAGGVVLPLPVFEQSSEEQAQRGQTWAGLQFFGLKTSQHKYLERVALGLKCQQFAGAAV